MMATDHTDSTDQQDELTEEELTEEELQLALDAAREIDRIFIALEELSEAYGGNLEGFLGSRSYASLTRRRQELRTMLLDLG